MLGNGLSSSPSNTPPPFDRARFPRVTFYDQVQAQHKLVTEQFGIETLRAGHRLVDGRRADLPVGRQPPGHGPAGVPVLRLLEDQRAQLRLPRGRQGGADRGRGLQGGLVRRAAGQGPARRRARLRRLGLLAGLLLGPGLQATWATRGGSAWTSRSRRWRTSWSGSGRATSWTRGATPTTCCRCSGPGSTGDIGNTPGLRRRPRQGPAVDQGAADRAPGREGPLLPARGRAVGLAAHPQRRGAA